jgi:hypothetical protein
MRAAGRRAAAGRPRPVGSARLPAARYDSNGPTALECKWNSFNEDQIKAKNASRQKRRSDRKIPFVALLCFCFCHVFLFSSSSLPLFVALLCFYLCHILVFCSFYSFSFVSVFASYVHMYIYFHFSLQVYVFIFY